MIGQQLATAPRPSIRFQDDTGPLAARVIALHDKWMKVDTSILFQEGDLLSVLLSVPDARAPLRIHTQVSERQQSGRTLRYRLSILYMEQPQGYRRYLKTLRTTIPAA